MSLPKSFTQVEGWREEFSAAWRAQDTARTEALFPDLPREVAGEPARALTLRLWTILDAADNPFVGGGEMSVAAATSLLWVVRKPSPFVDSLFSPWFTRFLRRCLIWRVAIRERQGVDTVGEVAAFVEEAFMDAPAADGKTPAFNPVQMPGKHFAVSLCSEVLAEFPAFTTDALLDMPLAQFWQWFHAAREQASARNGRDYRHLQPTDRVNRAANRKLNAMRKADKAARETAPSA